MRRQHVIVGNRLDVQELAFRLHLAERHNLHAILLAVGRVKKQIAEVAPPLRIFQRYADGIDIFLTGPVIGEVHDELGVTAIVVVTAAGPRANARPCRVRMDAQCASAARRRRCQARHLRG
ncbi:hypothetical protein D3C87_1831650 [compost metagenome]